MRILLISIAIFFSFHADAQFTSATLQASGLTCSMCSNAIFKSLQTLPFVASVKPNIKESSFEMEFKPGVEINFDDIKKKVEDAGFFVADLYTTLDFSGETINKDQLISKSGFNFHILNADGKKLNGTKTIHFSDKGFVPVKTYNKNKKFTDMKCYETGLAEACCSKYGLKEGSRVYHVTI